VVPGGAAHYTALFRVRLPPVSRMASEIGDKDVVGCLAVPDCGYDARLHPTKPWWLYLTIPAVFFLYSLSPSLTLLLHLQIVNFYHFLFPNIFSLDVEARFLSFPTPLYHDKHITRRKVPVSIPETPDSTPIYL
jgi:hypothetical protein